MKQTSGGADAPDGDDVGDQHNHRDDDQFESGNASESPLVKHVVCDGIGFNELPRVEQQRSHHDVH